tara:strand:+ start:85 stop:318 length:234 start_codon:yes stop_codon:yes gene_type:complete
MTHFNLIKDDTETVSQYISKLINISSTDIQVSINHNNASIDIPDNITLSKENELKIIDFINQKYHRYYNKINYDIEK